MPAATRRARRARRVSTQLTQLVRLAGVAGIALAMIFAFTVEPAAADGQPTAELIPQARATNPTSDSAPDAEDLSVSIHIDPLDQATVARTAAETGKVPIRGSVTVANAANAPTRAGTITLSATGAFANATTRSAWLATAGSGALGDRMTSVPTPVVPPQQSVEVAFTAEIPVPEAKIAPPDAPGNPTPSQPPTPPGQDGTSSSDPGAPPSKLDAQVRGVSAELRTDSLVQQGRATILIPGARDGLSPVEVATILPVTADTSTGPLIPSTTLAELTKTDGSLTRLLEVADKYGAGVTLAIDPRVVVSIQALGADAPPSAAQWLEHLTTLSNQTFALPFADADTALARRAGSQRSLAPRGFSFATGGVAISPPDTTPTAQSQPSSTPSSAPMSPSTLSVTRPDLTWPNPATVTSPTVMAGPGGTAIVHSTELGDSWQPSLGTAVQLAGASALVIDDTSSELLRTAMSADSSSSRADALRELTSALALEAAPTARRITLALPREQQDGSGYADVMAALDRVGVVRAMALPPRRTPTGLPVVQYTPASVDEATLTATRQAIAAEGSGASLVDLYPDPTAARDELRVRLLTTLSTQTLQDLPELASDFRRWAVGARDGVRLRGGSDIQLIGRESAVPVFIENTSDRTVRVIVHVRAQTGHLRVGPPQPVTVNAHEVARVQVPVTAIANGQTRLEVSLWAGETTQLPGGGSFAVNVNANMEDVAMVTVGAVVVLLFGFGTWRMLRRRRAGMREAAKAH